MNYTNTHKVVICYDSDSAGHDAAAKAFLEMAACGMDVRVANMPVGEDPDSLIKSSGPDSFRALLEESAEFFDLHLIQTDVASIKIFQIFGMRRTRQLTIELVNPRMIGAHDPGRVALTR